MSLPRVAEGNGTTFERAVVLAGVLGLFALPLALDTTALALAMMVPLAIAAVDFLSGVVHWLFDHHVAPQNRVLGRFAVDFLDHHDHPLRTLEVGFFKSAFRSTLFVALPLALLALWTRGAPYLAALLYGLAAFSLFAPQIHKFAHLPRPPRAIAWLQRSGVILSRRSHAQHHARPQITTFCIATGWCNPLLDATGFWRAADRAVAWVSARTSSGRH